MKNTDPGASLSDAFFMCQTQVPFPVAHMDPRVPPEVIAEPGAKCKPWYQQVWNKKKNNDALMTK